MDSPVWYSGRQASSIHFDLGLVLLVCLHWGNFFIRHTLLSQVPKGAGPTFYPPSHSLILTSFLWTIGAATHTLGTGLHRGDARISLGNLRLLGAPWRRPITVGPAAEDRGRRQGCFCPVSHVPGGCRERRRHSQEPRAWARVCAEGPPNGRRRARRSSGRSDRGPLVLTESLRTSSSSCNSSARGPGGILGGGVGLTQVQGAERRGRSEHRGRGGTGGGAEPAEPSWPRLLVSARAAGALLVSGCQAAEAEERPEEVTTVEVRLGHASCRGLRLSTYGNHEGQRRLKGPATHGETPYQAPAWFPFTKPET